MSREDFKKKVNWGTQRITQTSRLEKEIADLCLDNPQKLTRQALEKMAQGMRSRPITNVEPKDEVPDNLHFKINLSENLFTIQKRIVAIENDVHKQPKYENVAEKRRKKSSNRSKTNEIIPK